MASQLMTIRAAAAERQGWLCYYCGRAMWDADGEGFRKRHGVAKKMLWQFKCTAEHVIDRAAGGEDAPDNVVAACLFCNNRRSEWGVSSADFKVVAEKLEAAGRWRLGQGMRKVSLPKAAKSPARSDEGSTDFQPDPGVPAVSS
jgi:hypothetical protein